MRFPTKLTYPAISLCCLWFCQSAHLLCAFQPTNPAGRPVVRGLDPANPAATGDARRILNYLNGLSGHYDRHTILGPQFGPGQSPAGEPGFGLVGADYSAPGDRAAINHALIAQWKSGSLISITFRTSEQADWQQDLERAAASLAELRDAGVVVLWRPLPGANSNATWWGRANFVEIWRSMFDYLTKTRGLNNLLWVYSASSKAHAEKAVNTTFPGAAYCDLLALEDFGEDPVWAAYDPMTRLGKPLGAVGPERAAGELKPLITRMRNQFPASVFYLAGSGPEASLVAGFEHSWLLKKQDLDWNTDGRRRWKQSARLAVKPAAILTAEPAQWKRVDIRVDLNATYETPFDQDQIAVDALVTAPSGKLLTVPAFFFQNFERQVWGRANRTTEEVMAEGGPGEWRVRFMPSEPGKYSVRIRARDGSGTATSEPATFTARAGADHGYIRVSKKDPHYFEYDDGTPFFANGLNIVEHPLSEYYRYISRLGKAGGNFSRLWIGFEYFGLELGPMGDYRLDNAWQLDQVMELSEEYGIHQKFCIDWIRNITPRGLPRRNFDREDYAYSVSNGGPAATTKDFYILPEAKRLFKNRLRYIVARWAYSQNLMAWELWNEQDLVDQEVRDPKIIVPWTQEMCAYLKSVDPWQHLTTNSLARAPVNGWEEMWNVKETDFAQRHGYFSPTPGSEGQGADMAALVLGWLDPMRAFNKPYLMSEFGLQRDRMDIRRLCDRDQDGVHMHNGIWAAIAHGAAGTAQLWWWGQYVDPKNLYYHFQAVANFAKDVPWTTAGFAPATVKASDGNLRAVGLLGKQLSILWLQNKNHTWWNVINEVPIAPVEKAEVVLSGCAPGRHKVEYWNTWTGRVERTEQLTARGSELRIPVPVLARDMAVKIF
jgi:hypothetical protein